MQAGDVVPKLAANIAYMFTERPLLERIGAVARTPDHQWTWEGHRPV